MNTPTRDQILAASRHAVSFIGGGIATFAALHIITGGDADSANKALNQIGTGFAEIVAGVGTLMTIVSASYASLAANPLWQLIKGATAISQNPTLAKNTTPEQQAQVATAAQAMPEVKAVIAAPAVASLSPSNNVVTKPSEIGK